MLQQGQLPCMLLLQEKLLMLFLQFLLCFKLKELVLSSALFGLWLLFCGCLFSCGLLLLGVFRPNTRNYRVDRGFERGILERGDRLH